MRKSILLFSLTLFFLAVQPYLGASPIIREGTFLLRQRKAELDRELKKKYLQSPAFRAAIKNANRPNLIPGESEVGFQVYNFISGSYGYRLGLFIAEGKHCRVFIEKEHSDSWSLETSQIAGQIADTFDRHVYPCVTSWFGEPVIPTEFSLPDNKIFIFLVDIRDHFSDGYVAGYFDHRDIEGLFGNQKPVFFMDINPGKPGNPSDKSNAFYRTLAHEFQHMVSFSRRLAKGYEEQDRWLDEGLSMFSEFVFSGRVGATDDCLPPYPHFEKFIENPSINLFSSSIQSWFKEESLYRQNGGSFLFTLYLLEKYGGTTVEERQSFARDLVVAKGVGKACLDNFLVQHESSLKEVFCNWVVACYLNDKNLNNGKWHFDSIKTIADATVPQLPLNKVRHFYSRADSSFVGAEGSVYPNSPNLEEIIGDGPIKIRFSFDPAMCPALLRVNKDKTSFLQPLTLDEKGNCEIILDLGQLEKAAVLPIGIKGTFSADEKFNYTFNSISKRLLLYPVPNPAFSDQFVIILRSIESPIIATPSLNISFNNLIDRPPFSPVNDERKLFVAHYRIPGTGKGQAICYSGDDSCSFSFSAITARANEIGEISAGDATLLIESPVHNSNVSAMISQPSGYMLPDNISVLAGPYDLVVADYSNAVLRLKNTWLHHKGIGISSISENGEIKSWSNAEFKDGNLEAKISGSGRYFLIRDENKPEIKDFDATNNHTGFKLCASLRDDLSGIDPASVRLSINDKYVDEKPLLKEDKVIYSFAEIPAGEYDFALSVRDYAGNEAAIINHQTLAGNVYLSAPVVFPNPFRNRTTIRCDFSSAVNLISADARIYDCSGSFVALLDANQTAAGRVEFYWDACNRSGKKVANGVYFSKIRLHTSQGNFKSQCKIAVLR
ncbi:MAG: hypothetical protein Kow0029_25340 [Candidatus Rifleibacteriota bacterium]